MAPAKPESPQPKTRVNVNRVVSLILGVALLWAVVATGITFAAPTDESAEEPTDAQPLSVAPMRFSCRMFPTALDAAVDTRDHSTDLGRWVMDQEARGWAVHGVDFEVGQKPTGFAEGFVQVCMTPVVEPH